MHPTRVVKVKKKGAVLKIQERTEGTRIGGARTGPPSRGLKATPASAYQPRAAPWVGFPHCLTCHRRLSRAGTNRDLRACLFCGAALVAGYRSRANFLARVGQVRYSVIARTPKAWRQEYASTTTCEFDGCAVAGEYGASLVFDHCHEHNWVRGLVCHGHNTILGRLDAARRIPGVGIRVLGPSYAFYLSRCQDCHDAIWPYPIIGPSCWVPGEPARFPSSASVGLPT